MINEILRAIKDWCNGRFQPKGDYLTEVPEYGGYSVIIATEEPTEVGEKEIVLVVEST